MNKPVTKYLALSALAAATMAQAEVLDRPSGIKIGERLTLRPQVSAAVTYDSNVDANSGRATDSRKDDCLWTVMPSLGLDYAAENWSLLLSAYYSYRQYFDNSHRNYDHHNYGESLRWTWSNSLRNEKGWSVILAQSFQQVTMAEDMVLDGGSNYTGDQRQLDVSGAVQRRITEMLHAEVSAGYHWLDYMNDDNNRTSYYGWDRWQVGGEVGFAPSKWTDLLVSGSYMGYTQDNMANSGLPDESNGYSVQAGLGSYMTERISYRALAGWSRFEYADDMSSSDGFVYTLSANWKIDETWNTMFLASSYYQPSERQYATQTRVDSVSWGLGKVLVRGKLRATLDVRYRREEHEYALKGADWDYTLDIWTGRIGADYTLNRFVGLFAYCEYQNSSNDKAKERRGAYDYDRCRVTVGMKLTY